MNNDGFSGAWTALVSPMDEKGSIDWEGFEKNIEFQVSEGISGIVPAGTTGESPTLDWQEHKDIINSAVSLAGKRCGVIAGCGSNSARETMEIVDYASEAGVSAVLLVDCYYNAPSSLELRKEYYEPVAKEYPDLSVVPYIVPGRTGTALSPEDLALLSWKFPNVKAVKEATGDLERMKRIRELARETFRILSGDDDVTFNMMIDPRIQASGVISVMTNIVPGAIQRMTSAVASGEENKAREIQEKLQPLLGVVTVKSKSERVLPEGKKAMVEDKFRNPLAVKTMMRGLGIPAGECRRPLGRMTGAAVEKVRRALREVWEGDSTILEPLQEFYGVDVKKRIDDDARWDSLSYYD